MCIRDRNNKVFFQAEDGIRDLRMSRGLGDVYKRQVSIILIIRHRSNIARIFRGEEPKIKWM
ncbi:hypothetical protein JMUB7524_09030 [Staphylococcus aureus]